MTQPHDATDEPILGGSSGSDPTREDRDRDRKVLRWLLLAVVVVLGGLYVAAYAFAGDRLPQSTTIAGVDVGGMTPARAERVLRDELAGSRTTPVELVVEDRTFSLVPEEVGLEVDVPASVGQVPVGRSWNPADLWESFVGGEEYDAVVVTIDDLLTTRLAEIAEEVGEPAVEGGVTFSAEGAEPTYPEAGTSLDGEAVAAAVVEAFPEETTVEADLVTAQPQLTSSEVSRAMKEVANPAMSAPVTYVIGGERVELRPADYARALTMTVEGDELVLEVDRKKLLSVFRPAMRTIAAQPEDATVAIIDGRPQVVPAKKGVTVDYDKVVSAFPRLATATGDRRELTMRTEVAEPDFTAADARALGITEEVSEFTTYYPHADYRNVNIGRAAELVDGTVLKPGETFSLNATVGERTRENGFTEGFIISDGVFKEDLGGGVSQVATTTFNAAFFAGLEDVEHKPHSFYIDRYPVGREATVAWPVVDLKFKNDTEHGVLIQTVHQPSTPSSQGAITVRMWSTKVWDITARTGERYAYTAPETRYLDGDDCVPNEGYSGFQIKVTRVFREHGESEVHHREVFHTTYTPSDSVVCS